VYFEHPLNTLESVFFVSSWQNPAGDYPMAAERRRSMMINIKVISRPVMLAPGSSQPFLRTHRNEAVAFPQFDYAPVVLGLWKFLPQQTIAQAPQLVSIEIAHELVDERRLRPLSRVNTMPPELHQNIVPVTERRVS
jgi:hypothetical protein